MSSNLIYMNESEYNDLRRCAESSRSRLLITNAEIERIRSEIEANRRRYQQIVEDNRNRLVNTLDDTKRRINQRIKETQNQFDASLNRSADNMRNHISTISDELSVMNTNMDVLNSHITDISETYSRIFRTLEEQNHDTMQRATIRQEELANLLNQIEQLKPRQFMPSEYTSLVTLRDSVNTNILSGDANAALMVSQDAILDGTRLLATLVVLNQRYNNLMSRAQEALLGIQQRVQNLTAPGTTIGIELNGNTVNLDYDIRRWSFGQFDSLVSELNNIENSLNGNALTIEGVEAIIEQITDLDSRITSCDDIARMERAATVMVANAARRVADAMGDNGWEVESSGYVGGDKSKPYHITLVDGAGNRTAVVVNSEADAMTSYRIEVFAPEGVSPDERVVREGRTKEGIRNALRERGVEIDHTEHRDDCALNPDPETFIQNAVEEAMEDSDSRREEALNPNGVSPTPVSTPVPTPKPN